MNLMQVNFFTRTIAVLIIVLVYAGCKREEPIAEVKPLLKTNHAVVNTTVDGGLTMSGEFILSGSYRSIQYGFHLDTDASFKNPIIIPAGTDTEPNKFAVTAQVALKPDVKYYARAWSRTAKYEVFGNTIVFHSNGSSAPVIDKIIPENSFWGDTIMITGKNFDYFGKDNKVRFNEVFSEKTWGNQNTIWAIVPYVQSIQNYNLSVNVDVFNNITQAGSPLKIYEPVISGISTTEGQYPDTVTVTGNYFSAYTTRLMVKGIETNIFDLKRNSFSFNVPYLKEDQILKAELVNLKKNYPVADNFHYRAQRLWCPTNSAWIGDTIKLYAINIDFRRIMLDIKNLDPTLLINGNQSLIITQKWKDSLSFILKGNYQAPKFNLDIQFGKTALAWPFKTFTTVDQIIVNHRAPLLAGLEKREFVYGEAIKWKSKGVYLYYLNQGFSIKSVDGSVNLSFSDFDRWENYYNTLTPGDYYLQLFSTDRLSNTELFTIKVPKIETVTPSTFSRYDIIQIAGKNLPYSSNYKFTHIESGRFFMLRNWWESNNNETLKQASAQDIVGSGNYQLELNLGNKSYIYPGIVGVKDYFSYVNKMTDPFWQTSLSCGFAINNKVYIRHNGNMRIIDISTGKVQISSNNSYSEAQPVFFDNKVYLKVAKDGKYVIGSFNETTEDWDALNMEGVAAGFTLSCFGVCNNHLIAISSNGDIYQYNQKWIYLNNVKTNYYFLHYIYSANGNLYLCDFYMGKIAVVSTTDWKIRKEIAMPGTYENSLRYIFEIQGEMYFCAKPGGGVEDQFNLYRFNSDETFEALSPKKMKWDYYYQFCPDGKGNVYFVSEGYIYKFNP